MKPSVSLIFGIYVDIDKMKELMKNIPDFEKRYILENTYDYEEIIEIMDDYTDCIKYQIQDLIEDDLDYEIYVDKMDQNIFDDGYDETKYIIGINLNKKGNSMIFQLDILNNLAEIIEKICEHYSITKQSPGIFYIKNKTITTYV